MARGFAEIVGELCGGATYSELTARLAEVVDAVRETGKVGEISVKLKIKPNGDAGVLVTDEIKTRVPERTRGETVFFVTSGGSLVRQDPRQSELPLRKVEGAA